MPESSSYWYFLLSTAYVFNWSSLVFIVMSHLSPKTINRLVTNAWTSQLQWNFGPEAFSFQIVNVLVYHTTFLARLTHATLFVDVVSWSVILWHTGGAFSVVTTIAVIVVQALSFKNLPTFVVTVLSWGTTSTLAHWSLSYFAAATLEQPFVEYAHICVFLCAWARVIGHMPEPSPPLFLNKERQLRHPSPKKEKLKFHLEESTCSLTLSLLYQGVLHPGKVLVVVFMSAVAETSAGLPGRLFAPMIFVVWNKLAGAKSDAGTTSTATRTTAKRYDAALSMSQYERIAANILVNGWESYKPALRLFSPGRVLVNAEKSGGGEKWRGFRGRKQRFIR